MGWLDSAQEKPLVQQLVSHLQVAIDDRLPPGCVTPAHTDKGHFYIVPNGKTYSSVTGVIGVVKDPSIQQFQMNEALRYVERNLHSVITDGQVDMLKAIDLLDQAKKAPSGVLRDAGDIGTKIHDRREQYFQKWIDDKKEPLVTDFLHSDDDVRIHAGMLGIQKFVHERLYIPVRTEVMVYSDKYRVAGMLDDIGVMQTVERPASDTCDHRVWAYSHKYQHEVVSRCDKCNAKVRYIPVLMDLKTSNQFKDSYFYQVALYYMMFTELTGIKPKHNFILKVMKDQPAYKIETLANMRSLVSGAKKIVEASMAVDKVRGLRAKTNKVKAIRI